MMTELEARYPDPVEWLAIARSLEDRARADRYYTAGIGVVLRTQDPFHPLYKTHQRTSALVRERSYRATMMLPPECLSGMAILIERAAHMRAFWEYGVGLGDKPGFIAERDPVLADVPF